MKDKKKPTTNSYPEKWIWENILPQNNNSVCIAISDSPYSSDIQGNYKNFQSTLFLQFIDLEHLGNVPESMRTEIELQLFSEKQAHEIINFCLLHKDKDIIVHCTAGISRSHAVSLFIAKYIYKDLELFSKLYHQPYKIEGGNILVYRTLVSCYEFRMKKGIYSDVDSDTFCWD